MLHYLFIMRNITTYVSYSYQFNKKSFWRMQQVKMGKFWHMPILELCFNLYTAYWNREWNYFSVTSLLYSSVYWWDQPYWLIQIWVTFSRCICYQVPLTMRYSETGGRSNLIYPWHLHATHLYIKGTTHSDFTQTIVYNIYIYIYIPLSLTHINTHTNTHTNAIQNITVYF
jgi:hypothetical protein